MHFVISHHPKKKKGGHNKSWERHCSHLTFSSVQFSQSCPTLCDPMDCTPGLPVHHQLSAFTQTHVHWARNTIQPSHPLLSPSPPAFNLSQYQCLFKWVSPSHQVAIVLGASASASVLPMNIQDQFPLGWTGWISLQSKELSRVFLQHHSSKASTFYSIFYNCVCLLVAQSCLTLWVRGL